MQKEPRLLYRPTDQFSARSAWIMSSPSSHFFSFFALFIWCRKNECSLVCIISAGFNCSKYNNVSSVAWFIRQSRFSVSNAESPYQLLEVQQKRTLHKFLLLSLPDREAGHVVRPAVAAHRKQGTYDFNSRCDRRLFNLQHVRRTRSHNLHTSIPFLPLSIRFLTALFHASGVSR